MKCGIYKIENVVNNKYYIGSSNDIYRRWTEHKRAKDKCYLHYAIKKHGLSDFYFEVLEECREEDLLKIEQQYLDIAFLIPHMIYNNNTIADKPPSQKGKKRKPFSKEWCAKLSAANKGKKRPDISAVRKGKKLSSEHCAKLSAALKGRKHSAERRAKMSAAHKGRKYKPLSAEHCAKISTGLIDKTIHSFRNINTGEVFTGIRYDFYTIFNLNESNVRNLIKGNTKSMKGWVLI